VEERQGGKGGYTHSQHVRPPSCLIDGVKNIEVVDTILVMRGCIKVKLLIERVD